jgi:hypothetical protein
MVCNLTWDCNPMPCRHYGIIILMDTTLVEQYTIDYNLFLCWILLLSCDTCDFGRL